MTKKFFFIIVLLLSPSQIFAEIISETKYFSGIGCLNGSLTFSQFDNSSHILQSIGILMYLQSSGGILILDNDSSKAASGTFQFGNVGSVNSSDVILLNSSYLPCLSQCSAVHNQAFSLAPDNGDGMLGFDSSTPDGLSYSGTTEINVLYGSVDNAFWSLGRKGFLGTNSFNINYSVKPLIDYGNLSGMSFAVCPPAANGFITIIYTFEAPEVSTIFFFTCSLFILRVKSPR